MRKHTRLLVGAVFVLASAGLRAQESPDPTLPPAPPPTGIQVTTGDYTWKFGGYIKVDAIHDFDEIGSTDSFDVRTIPTSGENDPGSNTRIHARQTRLNLDVSGPTSAGPFRAFIEGDFFSEDNGFRLRHAFGEVGSVLGGQTWSTFMDEAAMPETLDYESPTAFPIVRQAQVRFTQQLEGGSYWAFAIEDPDSDLVSPTGVVGETDEPYPDLNARIFWKNKRGHVQLGLFGGMARFDPVSGSTDDAALWGLNLSTKIDLFDSDNAIVQVTYGDGVGRYRGGTTAAPDSNGNLEAVPVLGLLGSYQHFWSKEYRSTFGYSWGTADVPGGAPASANEELVYGSRTSSGSSQTVPGPASSTCTASARRSTTRTERLTASSFHCASTSEPHSGSSALSSCKCAARCSQSFCCQVHLAAISSTSPP